jgi:phosphatidylinositol alpha-1,6-mannosyltransferase
MASERCRAGVVTGAPDVRRLLWASLADQRPGRELTWLSLMPGTRVTAIGDPRPAADVDWLSSSYRRPVRRFVEAGALAWLRSLREVEPDFDWVGSLELCSLVSGQAGRWARRHRVRQVVVTWENLVHQPLYYLPPYREAFRRSLDADLLVCWVGAARDHLLAHGVDDDRIRVVRPGVDTDLFVPAAQPVAEPVAVFVSPLAANKGIDTVLDAMRIVRRTEPAARLLVMGSGPLEGRVRRAAADASSGVELLGPGTAQDVACALRRAAVFVTAPRATWKWNEQFGLAYVEAMSSGLPVVTTVCGTNHEAVQPPNLRTANSAEAVADGLLTFLTDPELRRRVGERNRAHVKDNHELTTQVGRLAAAFASIEAGG